MTDLAGKFGLGAGKGIIGFPSVPYGSGQYIAPALPGILTESGATATGFVYMTPFLVTYPVTVTATVHENTDTAASGQKARSGLYQFTSRIAATLLQAAAERTFTASAVVNEDDITDTQLVPGVLYGVGVTYDSSTVVRRIDVATTADLAQIRNLAISDYARFALDNTEVVPGLLRMAHVYGALPSSFVATSNNAQLSPFTCLKVA